LLVTSTGQVLTSLGGRTAYQVNFDRLKKLETARASESLNKEKVRHTLRELLALPSGDQPIRGTALSTNNRGDIIAEEFEFYSEPAVRVPGWFLKPAHATAKLPVVLIVSNAKNRIFDNLPLLAGIAQKKFAVCAVDLRAMGQSTPRLPSSGPLFYGHGVDMAYSLVSLTAGLPLTGQRTRDILCAIDYLQTRPDVETSRIGLAGTGAPGLEALYAATLDDRVHAVLLDRTLASFKSLVASADYNFKVGEFTFGLLKHFDLPQLASVVSPRPVWLLNPVDPVGEALPVSAIPSRYAETAKLRVESTPADAVLSEWIQETLL
jgi:pimeloyl-ACP methyl ester carboxylesterase